MTATEKYLDWIQADIDGELPASARAELARYLLANPEARALRDELKRLDAALGAILPEQPPADLHDRIMAALPPVRQPVRGLAPRKHWLGLGPTGLRFAAAIVGGALISTLAYQVNRHSTHDAGQLAGTMMSAERMQTQVDLGDMQGTIRLEGTPAEPIVGASLVSSRDVAVIIRLEDQQIRLEGFESGDATQAITRTAKFAVIEDRSTAEVDVEIVESATGSVLHRSTLRFDSLQ